MSQVSIKDLPKDLVRLIIREVKPEPHFVLGFKTDFSDHHYDARNEDDTDEPTLYEVAIYRGERVKFYYTFPLQEVQAELRAHPSLREQLLEEISNFEHRVEPYGSGEIWIGDLKYPEAKEIFHVKEDNGLLYLHSTNSEYRTITHLPSAVYKSCVVALWKKLYEVLWSEPYEQALAKVDKSRW